MRDLAFQIRRKQRPVAAFQAYVDDQGRRGRHREYRSASEALSDDDFSAALGALAVISSETALVLALVVDTGDDRLLAQALVRLADQLDIPR